MAAYNIYEAKTAFSSLIERAEHGEEMVIARADKPVARIVPFETTSSRSGQTKRLRPAPGSMGGDFSALLEALDEPSNEEEQRAFGMDRLMRLLLDSHVFIWFSGQTSPLSSSAVQVIRAADEVFISAAIIWERTFKRASGKLEVSGPLIQKAQEYRFAMLPVSPEHGEAVGDLPFHPRDPFDHLLLAQARLEGLTLVTHDDILAQYGVPVLLV